MGVNPHRALLALLLGFLVVAVAAAGYALGKSTAPSASEADVARSASSRDAFLSYQAEAFSAGQSQGRRAGESRGNIDGRRAGTQAGKGAGADKADEKLAAIQAEEEAAAAAAAQAAASPEDLCASSIDEPGVYGQCLDANGQDPGAPLTDYCALHPEIVATAGFCPSLNE